MVIDDCLHQVAKQINNVKWKDCKDYGAPDDTFEWYYAENQLYVLRHKKMKTLYLVNNAKGPAHAFEIMKRKYLSQGVEHK